MRVSEARQLVGGLSNASKMPSKSYGLPAQACKVGGKLRKVEGSTCENCYAYDRGMYVLPVVKTAQARRLVTIKDVDWAANMAKAINKDKLFRWHDSGDLQGPKHLTNIFEVCKRTPETSHWLPTQERKFLPLSGSTIPKNLIIRLSNAKNDTVPGQAWSHWSTVVTVPRAGHVCPAPEQGNECGSCRACWSKDVYEVQYKIH